MSLSMKDKKSIYLQYQTLAALVKALTGSYTVIDLRNEASVYGQIVETDGYMNIEMKDCVFQTPRGDCYPFDNFFVKCRNIRFVHVPKDESAIPLIESQFIRRPKPQQKKPIFKLKRSALYQKEILNEIASTSKQ